MLMVGGIGSVGYMLVWVGERMGDVEYERWCLGDSGLRVLVFYGNWEMTWEIRCLLIGGC